MGKRILFQSKTGPDKVPLPHIKLTTSKLPLDRIEQLIQQKILERTKLHDGKFVYQQAYRLLELNRGKGIDFISFKHAINNIMCLDICENDLEILFFKYDVNKNGILELYEFIDKVLPQDYDLTVHSWLQKSVERCDEKEKAMQIADRNIFLGGRSFDDIPSSTKRWNREELRRDISLKLHQRIPKCIDRLRCASILLQCGAIADTMTPLDLRQSIRDTLGIAMSEIQTKTFLNPFLRKTNRTIDLISLLQYIFQSDEPKENEIREGIFPDDEKDENLHYGKRHIVPGKGEVLPQRYQKRVHGYFRIKNKNNNPLRLQKPPPTRRRYTTKFQVPSVATVIRRAITAPPMPRPVIPSKPNPFRLDIQDTTSQESLKNNTPRRPPPRLISPVKPIENTIKNEIDGKLVDSFNSIQMDDEKYNSPRIAISHQLQISTIPYKSNKPNWRVSENTLSCR